MTPASPAEHEPDHVERPSEAAQLKIRAEPARLKVIARRWLTAEGTVPPANAEHLISAFGIVGCVVTGCAAAVLTMHAGTRLTSVAFAELAVALAGAILIAFCGPARHESGRQGKKEGKRQTGQAAGDAD
jgi:hypothetical protein